MVENKNQENYRLRYNSWRKLMNEPTPMFEDHQGKPEQNRQQNPNKKRRRKKPTQSTKIETAPDHLFEESTAVKTTVKTQPKSAKTQSNQAKQSNKPRPRRTSNNNRNVPQNTSRLSRDTIFFTCLLFVSLYATYNLVEGFIHPIICGVLTGAIFYPLYRMIRRWVKGRKTVAAVLTCSAIVMLIFIPCAIFFGMVVNQGIMLTEVGKEYISSGKAQDHLEAKGYLQNENVLWALEKGGLTEEVHSSKAAEKDHKNNTIDEGEATDDKFGVEPEIRVSKGKITSFFKKHVGSASNMLKSAPGQVLDILAFLGKVGFSFAIMLMVTFFTFTDGSRLLRHIQHLSPMPRSEGQQLLKQIRSTSKSAVLGTIMTACAQGVLGMIGFAIAGVPALFLGVMVGFSSLIPVVGTALVFVPTIIILSFISPGYAIFLGLWALIVVGGSDYILRPFFMKGENNMPTVLLLFAIMGGVTNFGLLGFVYGPLIFGITAVMLLIYENRNSTYLKDQDKS